MLPTEVVDVPFLEIQSEVGWGFKQPYVVEDVPGHCRGIGLEDL